MAFFLLIRHGLNDTVGRSIAGRASGTRLNREGHAQAEDLARFLQNVPLTGLCSSPLERARETAGPLAKLRGMEVRICPELQEIDYGNWTGRSLQELEGDSRWRKFNTFRSGTRVPGGEMISEVQARMVGFVENLREETPHGVWALFSHGDPIKTVLAHYGGIPLDFVPRLEVSPASVSLFSLFDHGPRILGINLTGLFPGHLLQE